MTSSFGNFKLDQRLLKAIADLNWETPTDVQEGVIPKILEKRNVIIGARTGSGKTASYMIPIIQDLILSKINESQQKVSVLLLCPSKELCAQTKKILTALTKYLDFNNVDVSAHKKREVLRPVLLQCPDFVIGTPSQVLSLVTDGSINISDLNNVVMDEADLMSGLGYREDLDKLSSHIDAEKCQFVMLSATLDKDVKDLRDIFKGRWFKIELKENELLPSVNQLTQYVKRCEEDEKYNIIIGMLKLNLIRGKTIIFSNSVDKCYRLRIVLDSFYVNSVVLNAEMPLASRNHIVHEFNRGRYDLLLASDENNCFEDGAQEMSKKLAGKDEEFSISRGVDFNLVSNVINFDCPNTVENYVHRVGRTARVKQKGSAVTFVRIRDNDKFKEIDDTLKINNNDVSVFHQFNCRKEMYEGFIYRVSEVRGKCTKKHVKEARLLDIHKEITNSAMLKAYFEDNPMELSALNHSKPLVTNRSQHMRNVPSYLIPAQLQDKLKKKKKNGKNRSRTRSQAAKTPVHKTKTSNPLKTFKSKNKK